MFLKYVGTSDYRELSAADFRTLGAEANKTRFVQHEVVEVPDDTGQVLLEHESLKGEFEEVEPEDNEDLQRIQLEGKNEQSESLRRLEAGQADELPATTQRSGGPTDADTADTTAGTASGTVGGTAGGTGRRGSRSATTRKR